MRRHLLALAATVCLAGLYPAAAAATSPPPGLEALQAGGQLAQSAQQAAALALSAQYHPVNSNVAATLPALPGDDKSYGDKSPASTEPAAVTTAGPVTQSNSSEATALAGNKNATEQAIVQAQQGGGGSPVPVATSTAPAPILPTPSRSGTAVQEAGQSAVNEQAAEAGALSAQIKPENTNISVRILSPGDDGPVTQSNSSEATALAGNKNSTGQDVVQSQGGGSGTTVQAAGQQAGNSQSAAAWADSIQVKPTNTNISVRILSPGNNGPVTQSNSSEATALAGNKNSTGQDVVQSQGGGGGGTSVQAAGQAAWNDQDALAGSESVQVAPRNTNVSGRIGSPDGGGEVSQSNESSATAAAANLNRLRQAICQFRPSLSLCRNLGDGCKLRCFEPCESPGCDKKRSDAPDRKSKE